MAKEPSQFEMKKQFNLPEDAVFLGWVIHHPENDEYVVTWGNRRIRKKSYAKLTVFS